MYEIEADVSVFAANLDRLMTLRGMRNSALAALAGVSRQNVSHWRQGRCIPVDERLPIVAHALRCKVSDLFTETVPEPPAMLPVVQWAKREGIPLSRALSLFEVGLLTGLTGEVGEVQFVPAELHAPADSKKLLRKAQRPDWIVPFAINLDAYMRTIGISNAELAAATGVGQGAVMHWRSGRGYPVRSRLPLIANALRCGPMALFAPPSAELAAVWKYRYGQQADNRDTWIVDESEAA